MLMNRLCRFTAGLVLTLVSVTVSAQYLQTTMTTTESPGSDADTLVVLVPSGSTQLALPGWSQATIDQVNRALAARDFDGSARQQVEILAPAGLSADRLIAVGVGAPDELTRHVAEEIGAALSVHINGSKAAVIEADTRLILPATPALQPRSRMALSCAIIASIASKATRTPALRNPTAGW